MDGNYIITANGGFANEEDLYHWGIKGMRWGVRRYQNADGSLTAAGRKRYTNSDGSLNEKGKKYYAKEKQRLAEERKALKAKQSTDNKLAKLDAQRKANDELKRSMDPKQKEIEAKREAETKLGRDVLNPYLDVEVANLSTNDLTAMNNRLNQAINFRTNMEKMGYTFVDKTQLPKSDIDYKIEELKKQKELLGLEKDISDLKPKKVNKGAEIAKTLLDKVVIPVASEYGKKAVEKYFKDVNVEEAAKLAKKAAKEVESQKVKVEKSAEKQAEKQAKKEEKAAEKQAKVTEKQEEKQASKANSNSNYVNDVFERASANAKSNSSFYDRVKSQQKSYDFDWDVKTGTVEGVGASSRKNKNGSTSSTIKPIVEEGKVYYDSSGMQYWASTSVTDIAPRNTSTGRSYVTRYLNSPISGYLPAPKDRDD